MREKKKEKKEKEKKEEKKKEKKEGDGDKEGIWVDRCGLTISPSWW